MEIVFPDRLGPSLNQDLEELKRPRGDADGTLRAHELARLRVEDAVTESDAHPFPRKNHRSPTDPPRRRGRCGASVIIAQNVRMDGLRAEPRRTCSRPSHALPAASWWPLRVSS